jgi:hypothetical protein
MVPCGFRDKRELRRTRTVEHNSLWGFFWAAKRPDDWTHALYTYNAVEGIAETQL